MDFPASGAPGILRPGGACAGCCDALGFHQPQPASGSTPLVIAHASPGLTHQFYKLPRALLADLRARSDQRVHGARGHRRRPVYGWRYHRGGGARCRSPRCGDGHEPSLHILSPKPRRRPFAVAELANVLRWAEALADAPTAHLPVRRPSQWIEAGYQRNLTGADLWPIRKTIEVALDRLDDLEPGAERRLARAIVLRTAQSALDTKNRFPRVGRFREALRVNAARDDVPPSSSSIRPAMLLVVARHRQRNGSRCASDLHLHFLKKGCLRDMRHDSWSLRPRTPECTSCITAGRFGAGARRRHLSGLRMCSMAPLALTTHSRDRHDEPTVL